MKNIKVVFFLLFSLQIQISVASESIARKWNEVTLEAIRNDFARPTVHARNLFHISAAMYDAWAVFDDSAKTYLLGNQLNGFANAFQGIKMSLRYCFCKYSTISNDQIRDYIYTLF